MFGQNPRVNLLAARKQLLLAESDLNRAQMIQEGRDINAEIHSLTHRVKQIAAMVSIITSLMAALSASRQPSTSPVNKSSWWQTLVNSTGLISSLWLTFRSRRTK